MPLPEPGKGESREVFMTRCMGNDTMRNEYPDTGQRWAVCRSQWEGRNRDQGRNESSAGSEGTHED